MQDAAGGIWAANKHAPLAIRAASMTYRLIGRPPLIHTTCRNRHCPKCQGAASRRWLAEREAELLPVPYFHVVYTLPSQLRDIAYQNKRGVYDLLMKAAAETTLAIAADPKRLGARIGITAVPHTWGSALNHPHVHMVQTTGQGTILLESEKTPAELDHAAPDASVAGARNPRSRWRFPFRALKGFFGQCQTPGRAPSGVRPSIVQGPAYPKV
jgi:hypothetical protein